MKSFSQFLKEGVETSASTQAKRLGLEGDGHGDWYDKDGTLVAKTVSGKLKFFGQGKKSKEEKSNVEKPTTSKPDVRNQYPPRLNRKKYLQKNLEMQRNRKKNQSLMVSLLFLVGLILRQSDTKSYLIKAHKKQKKTDTN